jgi:hypothetical protein
MGRLHRQGDDRLLAGDRVRLEPFTADDRLPNLLFLVLMAGNATVALHGSPVNLLVFGAPQPLVAGLAGIEQRHRIGGNILPVNGGEIRGKRRPRNEDGQVRQKCWLSHLALHCPSGEADGREM